MKEKLKEIILGNDGKYIPRRMGEIFFKKNYPELSYEIDFKFNNDLPFTIKLYMIINNIIEIPKCLTCGKNVNFKNFHEGFSKFCSTKCVNLNEDIIKKKENTMLKNHGVKYTMQSKKLMKQIYNTNMKLYNVGNPQQCKEIKERTNNTNIKLYGYSSPAKNETIKEKTKNTNLKLYNCTCLLQSKTIKEEYQKNNTKKYGNKIPSKNIKIIEKIKKSINKTLTDKSIEYWIHALNLNLGDVAINNDDLEIKNYCNKHNKFIISRSLLKNRLRQKIENICTLCNPINENVSIKENEVKEFIENKLNIKTTKHKIENKEIDIYLPDYNLGIEFDGLYWHSDIYKNNNYHLNKTKLCEKNNIQLLHVFEDEWMYKKEIVKSIIKSKLNLITNKIYARKCIIKEIDNNICKEFLENNHIQGNINSKIKIGLFYNNELISAMTFGKKKNSISSKNKIKSEYEMHRFCNKLNTTVVGGASKLLKYFIETYKPKLILAFADRRYSQGNLYKQLGFTFVGYSKPNYWYFKHYELIRQYRFNFRKDILVKQGFDPNKTEKIIMAERKYLKIYDCGTSIFNLPILLK